LLRLPEIRQPIHIYDLALLFLVSFNLTLDAQSSASNARASNKGSTTELFVAIQTLVQPSLVARIWNIVRRRETSKEGFDADTVLAPEYRWPTKYNNCTFSTLPLS
jgi:hypothetical protein